MAPAAMKFIRVKEWDRFQHYKDRSPPWIKLYNDLLDDYAFACLQDASKMHLIGIWLLASRLENRVPADPNWIANKIGATEPVDLQPLLSAGFITLYRPDSDVLAECEQDACLEGEAEGEAETDLPTIARGETRKATDRDLDEMTVTKIRGLYGWKGSEGTDPVLVKAFKDPADRDRCLQIAIDRLESEPDGEYRGNWFRKILTSVIEEQKEPARTSPKSSGPAKRRRRPPLPDPEVSHA